MEFHITAKMRWCTNIRESNKNEERKKKGKSERRNAKKKQEIITDIKNACLLLV